LLGIKVHTMGHAISLTTKDAEMIFETTNELEVPVMIHIGPGIPFASPTHAATYAEKYLDLSIILSHSGLTYHAIDALIVSLNYKNIYLETSWCTAGDILNFIKTLGADRVMFGTDLPDNVSVELGKLKALNLKDEEKEWFLHKTGEKVFKISIK